MDWNAKWDWENLALFNLKTEIPKQQTTDWGIVEGEEIRGSGPFRLYEGKDSSSGSELAPGSSARSSISVCTDSAFENINAFSGDKESPPAVEYSVGSGESLIGLKLGKRMYFENNRFGSSSTKTVSFPQVPVSSTVKKTKSSNPNNPRCQVEGCNIDLSSAKEYHRKHKVCASHSKYPKVVVAGVERRFCQQCSRFHSLSEFDEKKRSCRRRLSDHNARRRKPQLEPMQFNTMRLPSSISDSTRESSFSSKLTSKKECLLEFGKIGGLDEQLQLSGTQLPHTISLPDQSFNRLIPPKGAKSETSPRGFKESVLAPNLDSAPDFNSALSLLSNDSWSSFSLSNNSREHSMSIDPMPLMQGFPQSFPQSSLEFCQTDHRSTDSLTATANDIGHFQLFKSPYENSLYSNLFN